MAKNLVIVESPNKCKKIQEYLGKDFKVVASYGHIRDLEKGSAGVDKKNNYTPSYIVSPDKKEVVATLKKLAKDSEIVWLAGDFDREGTAISWHVKETLGLTDKKTRRIVFTEITKKAITDAVANPVPLDMNMVRAQEARRILDRLVGFDLSPLLWKKINNFKLSAGRVQSPAVRLIVEREREINSFESQVDFKTTALFETEKRGMFKALLNKRFENYDKSKKFLEQCVGKQFKIRELEIKAGKKSPSAPFTTSTLQQTAGSQLGFSVKRTTDTAQALYTAGLISYMRTDSVILSEDAIKSISSEIKTKFGDKYLFNRTFKSKASAQEAHEACRPTDFSKTKAGSTSDEERLYELIYKRTLSSQMSDAITERTVAYVNADGVKEEFIARGEVIKFDGFLKVYTEIKNDDDEEDDAKLLPPLKKGEKVFQKEINSFQYFTKPPARFNEPGLVKKLEDAGIGRPSTFSSILQTIQKRNYVEKRDLEAKERKIESFTLTDGKITETSRTEKYGSEKGRLCPTDTGLVVVDYLMKNFSDDIMDYQFTANAEEKLDDIAEGRLDWVKMIDDFYKPFSKKLKDASGEEGKAGVRELGNDPKTGKKIFARLGKWGPCIQLGETKAPEPKEKKDSIESKVRGKKVAKTKVVDSDKPKFAKLKQGQSIETITLKEALELLSWPKTLGKHKGNDIVLASGKFGPYIKIDGVYCSVKEPDNIETITLERAIELFEEKALAKKNMVVKEFKSKNISVLNGKFGIYIKHGDKNCKIPPEYEAKDLTLKQCEDIIKNAKPSKKWKKKEK